MKRCLAALATLGFLMSVPSLAMAFGGTVTGRFFVWQNQGNFCPASLSPCVGARYLWTEYNTYVPVRDARFKVALWSDWSQIVGAGNSDANGNITINWYHPSISNPQVVILTTSTHSSFRFSIQDFVGNYWVSWAGPFTITNGATFSAGNLGWGSPGNPSPNMNVYDGAWRMWNDSLVYSNRMVNSFTSVVIQAFEPAVQPPSGPWCGTSCASGSTKTIRLDANAAYQPQARIMHECGHIASYLSRDWTFTGDTYCYPNTSCGSTIGSWSLGNPSWGNTAFEEGLATFFGDVALYWANAGTNVQTCLSTGACSGFNVETHTAGTNCASTRTRYPLSVDSYLRDLYDSNNESATGTSSTCPTCTYTDLFNIAFYNFFDTLAAYPTGTGLNQNNEHWNSAMTSIDNVDGRGAASFQKNLETYLAVFSSNTRALNCTPP